MPCEEEYNSFRLGKGEFSFFIWEEAMKVAVSGFRHGHIASVVKQLRGHPNLEVVAAAEEEPDACRDIIEAAGVEVKYGSLDAMMEDVDFDILAIGDIFTKRGVQAIKALEAGKHVMADKPLCTRLEEMASIRELSESKHLSVIVALTMRYDSVWVEGRRLLRDGGVGQVTNVAVFGHHPLRFRTGRPDWYFEPGRHGGTLTDILIHAVDSLWWLTGHPVVEVIAARAWNAEVSDAPFFQDAAQAMLRLENNAGVIADVSYKAPRGHSAPWTMHVWGTEGYLTMMTPGDLILRRHDEPEKRIPAAAEIKTDYAADLMAEITGDETHGSFLTTAVCLSSSEKTLRIQEAADKGLVNVAV